MFYEMAEAAKSGDGPDTEEAEALAGALNHSAERVQSLWFSFLTFMVYLAIATGTTTHRMLFLESPLNLPVLNIALPLLGFYILTPIIFVIFHFYMLLNLVLLARTAKSFEDSLVCAFPDGGEPRETFRMRIENTLFVQLLVGGRLEREGINAKLLSLMALITLAVAPVALLLMIQIKFLPYHSEWITWLHRSLLALDFVLVWTLWPGYRNGWGVRLWPKASWWRTVLGVLSAVALAYAVMVATFPDEHMYLATNLRSGEKPNWYDSIAPINTLDLNAEDLIDDAKLAHITEKNESSTNARRWAATLPLAGRDLTGADLSSTDVRHVNLTGAILNRAKLSNAWLEKAYFDFAQLRGASLKGAQLQGALLRFAQLQGASLDSAQLQGASLDSAQLQGASLDSAQLQGASLDDAQFQGTSLKKAQLQGASLIKAQLQGASLNNAQLQGAILLEAHLQGASLDGAQLQGAFLLEARFQSASLWAAQLQGASLAGVDLRGALLDSTQLQGASFAGVCVWRTDARQAGWEDTKVATSSCGDWNDYTFNALRQLIASSVPDGDKKSSAMDRIERLDPTKPLDRQDEMANIWAAREHMSPTPEAYAKKLARLWRGLGCTAEGSPYVLQGLIIQLRYPDSSPFHGQSDAENALAPAFLDEAHCPGAHGLSEADKSFLKMLAAPPAPQEPKP